MKSESPQFTEDFVAQNNEAGFRRLEIFILSDNDQFQEVEIAYGNKKIRKKITRRLPINLASGFFLGKESEKPQPSAKIGATNSVNLSNDSEVSQGSFLKEKFLRSLAKVNQMYETLFDASKNFNYEKFWDGAQRIQIDEKFNRLSESEKSALREEEMVRRSGSLNTMDKAILVAMFNHLPPESQMVDRTIVSAKFSEISDKKSFKKFADEVVKYATDYEKLASALFPNFNYGAINAEKKSNIVGCLSGILKESDEESSRGQKLRLLTTIVNEVVAEQKCR